MASGQRTHNISLFAVPAFARAARQAVTKGGEILVPTQHKAGDAKRQHLRKRKARIRYKNLLAPKQRSRLKKRLSRKRLIA